MFKLPKPKYSTDYHIDGRGVPAYTEEEVLQFARTIEAEARREAFKEAAELCMSEGQHGMAAGIIALIDQPAQGGAA